MKKYLKNIISLVIFLGAVFYLLRNGDVRFLEKLEPLIILQLFGLNLFFYFIISVPMYFVLKKISDKISLNEIFGLGVIANFLNLVLPARGGVIYRGVFLKKRKDIRLRDYSAMSLFLSISGILVLGIWGGIGIPFLNFVDNSWSRILIILSGVLFVSGILLLNSTKLLSKISSKLDSLINEKTLWSRTVNKTDNITIVIVTYSLSMISYSLRVYLLLGFFQIELSFLQAVGITTLVLIVNLVPVLPGNMGIREATFAGCLQIIGHSYEIGIYLAIFDRLVQMLFLASFGLFYSWKLDLFSLSKDVDEATWQQSLSVEAEEGVSESSKSPEL